LGFIEVNAGERIYAEQACSSITDFIRFEPPKALSHWISTAGTLVRLRSKCAASFFGFLGAFLSAEKERMPLKSNPFEPMSDARSNFTYSRQPSFDRLGTPAQIRLCAVVLKSIGCSSA